MRLYIYFIFLCGLFLKFFNAEAQESKIKFGAYLDAYYNYDFSKPIKNRLYVTQYDRHNEFNINHALVSADYNDLKTRAELDLHVGTYPANNYSAEPELMYKFLHRAYAGYKITKNGWLDIGVFGGHFGYESVLALERELYSPALATEYTPYYQSGVRYTHDFTDKTQLRAVILNGWQNIGETNQFKSFGLAIDHQLNEYIWISYGNYAGKETIFTGDHVMRYHNNFTISYQLNDQWKATGVADYLIQQKPGDAGNNQVLFLTAISSYQLNDQWSVAARYEKISDEDAILIPAITGAMKLQAFSLAINQHASENATLKLEGKIYESSDRNFGGEKGVGKGMIVVSGGIVIKI